MEEKAKGRTGPSAAFAIAPALAGIGVAVLYTVGAVLTAGSLRQSGISIRDALPLIPLTQLLDRGMSVFLSSFGFAVLVLGSIGISLYLAMDADRRAKAVDAVRSEAVGLERRIEALDPSDDREALLEQITALKPFYLALKPPHERPIPVWTARLATAVLVIVAFLVHVSDLPAVAVGVLLFGLAGAGVLRVHWALVLLAVITWFSALMTSYYYASPFAVAVVTTTGHERVHGGLITHGSGGWVLAGDHGQMVVVPEGEVAGVSIRGTGKPRYPRKVYKILTSLV